MISFFIILYNKLASLNINHELSQKIKLNKINMGSNEKDSLKRLSDLFGKDPSIYSIFEDQIDIDVQNEFYKYLEELTPEFGNRENNALENTAYLYNKDCPLQKKKKILLLLSNINKTEAYRAIEHFKKEGDQNLRKWASIALQQSRMLLESTLLEEKSIFISTGLGGKNGKLRYFCVFFTTNTECIELNEEEVIEKEIEFAFKKEDAILESLEFTRGIIAFKTLIPINTNIKKLFDGIIYEINNYGPILKENMIITNIKSLTAEEIDHLLNKKSEE